MSGRAPPARRTWAELVERTFAEDALRCLRCGERRRRIPTVTDPPIARRLLRPIGPRHGPLPRVPDQPTP